MQMTGMRSWGDCRMKSRRRVSEVRMAGSESVGRVTVPTFSGSSGRAPRKAPLLSSRCVKNVPADCRRAVRPHSWIRHGCRASRRIGATQREAPLRSSGDRCLRIGVSRNGRRGGLYQGAETREAHEPPPVRATAGEIRPRQRRSRRSPLLRASLLPARKANRSNLQAPGSER